MRLKGKHNRKSFPSVYKALSRICRAVDKGQLDSLMADSTVAPIKSEINSNSMNFPAQPKNEISDNSNSVYTVGQYAPKVLQNLNSQRLNNQFSDVGLIVGNTIIRAHRSVLAASSAYFNAMFTGGLVEEQQELVEIHSIPENILSILIDFIYSGNVNVTQDNVQELFAAADMLELNEVVSSCISYLEEQLHFSNALGIYRFAETHNCADLLETALRFIQINFPRVSQEEEFLDLPKEHLVSFLSSENIHIDTEFQVFEAAYNWITHDIPARRCYVFEIFSHIRLRLCSMACLNQIIYKCNDGSLTVALTSIKKDLICNKGCLVPLRVQPRHCAKKNILVIGGIKRDSNTWVKPSESIYDTVNKYNTFKNTWSEVAPVQIERVLPGVALLSGKVYVVGGEIDYDIIASGECYDPHDNVWTSIACMVEPRCEFGLCAFNNNLYAFGGWVGEDIGDTIEIYDPVINFWTVSGKLPEPRFSMGVVAYDGLIYIVGGCSHDIRHRKDVMSYNPSTQEWRSLAPMMTPRSQMGIAVLDDYMYVVGGTNKYQEVLSSVERYSFKKNTWAIIPPLTVGRSYPAVAAADNHLYVIGGDHQQEINFYWRHITVSSVERYDPLLCKWFECAPLPNSRGEAAAVAVHF
ncbi:PREDICTED: actin-binding protein IPP [Ceratosolen solmsi marchali]|uniref:Kelch-like protein diablo n=1 Tax=Ceratosolen solmsi marchali TaxID=326594 RepID=A0AAJ7DXW9_9HYME|nr:PREDICTED: actin-binding protein IPP [Ceratosolen solmsi marchali]